ncbi:MAG: DUF302 domain-containing protein [Gammaproteobacteria bacterium]|nr:DUF302 domain-containing protein [Gammaproteobacteria bacterium]
MVLIRNLLALVGLAVVAGVAGIYVQYKDNLNNFDPEAGKVYMELAKNVLESGNGADATVWKVPVNEDLSADDVEETMKFVANELNMSNVGELPLYKDVEAKTGQSYRFVKIYMFCNSLIAKEMLDYSDSFSAYLPCRITLVEDKSGKLWLFTLNMDLMIYGGETLPPTLKKRALEVKDLILQIMQRGAEGDF